MAAATHPGARPSRPSAACSDHVFLVDDVARRRADPEAQGGWVGPRKGAMRHPNGDSDYLLSGGRVPKAGGAGATGTARGALHPPGCPTSWSRPLAARAVRAGVPVRASSPPPPRRTLREMRRLLPEDRPGARGSDSARLLQTGDGVHRRRLESQTSGRRRRHVRGAGHGRLRRVRTLRRGRRRGDGPQVRRWRRRGRRRRLSAERVGDRVFFHRRRSTRRRRERAVAGGGGHARRAGDALRRLRGECEEDPRGGRFGRVGVG